MQVYLNKFHAIKGVSDKFIPLCFLLLISCGVHNSDKDVYLKISKKYSDQLKMNIPTIPLHEYDIPDFIKYKDFHNFRAKYNKHESVTSAICNCLNDKPIESQRNFRDAIKFANFTRENVIFLPDKCKKFALKAFTFNDDLPCKNIENEPNFKILKEIFILDQKERTRYSFSNRQIYYDSINFIKFYKIANWYIDNYFCLTLKDSIPHIRILYAHNDSSKADFLLKCIYNGISKEKYSYDELEIVLGTKSFRNPSIIQDGVKFYCFERVYFDKNGLDIPLSLLQLNSIVKYLKSSSIRKLNLYFKEDLLKHRILDIERWLLINIKPYQCEVVVSQKSNLMCDIAYSIEYY